MFFGFGHQRFFTRPSRAGLKSLKLDTWLSSSNQETNLHSPSIELHKSIYALSRSPAVPKHSRGFMMFCEPPSTPILQGCSKPTKKVNESHYCLGWILRVYLSTQFTPQTYPRCWEQPCIRGLFNPCSLELWAPLGRRLAKACSLLPGYPSGQTWPAVGWFLCPANNGRSQVQGG